MDLYTDGKFVDDMFSNSLKNPTHFKALKENCTEEYYREMEDVAVKAENKILFHPNLTLIGQECRNYGLRFGDPHMHKFTECFIYSLFHCIAPIIWTILVFTLTMNVSNIWKIPFPPITRVVRFYQDIQMSKMRSRWDFKEKVPEIEAKIANYEDSVNLSSSIEAALEASPQFFFQTVYFLPNLIINLVRSRSQGQGWQELVSYKMLSIAFSFTSVAVSNYFIRYEFKYNP